MAEPTQRGDLSPPTKPLPGDPLAKPPPQPVGITEDAAALLWCPFMSLRFDPNGAIYSDTCCIASRCMMWHADEPVPNSDQRTGWCGVTTLAPSQTVDGAYRAGRAEPNPIV